MSSTLRTRWYGAFIFRAVAFAALGVSLPAQQRSNGVGLAVYADEDFRGRSATFRDEVTDLRPFRLNDQITSLDVGRGETWEVCEDINFGGRCQVVTGAVPDLRQMGWSDTISSARRVRDNRGGRFGFPSQGLRSGIELYSDTGFSGRRIAFDEAVDNLQPLNFNDRAMSVRIGRNESWELCSDADYRNCRIIDNDVSDLSRIGLSTRISSLRPVSGPRVRDLGNARARGARLMLYDERNFRGRTFAVDDRTADLRDFRDKAESVRVDGGAWEVCSEANFRGRCEVITDDQSDLGRLGLRNNVASARPARREGGRQ